MKSVDVLVSGRVQGVGFRAYTRKNAVMLGVKGYVENLPDGRVHARVEGDGHQVDKLIELLKHGPSRAEVRDVKVTAIEAGNYKEFNVR